MYTERRGHFLLAVFVCPLALTSMTTGAAGCMPGPDVPSPPKAFVENAPAIYLARAVSARLIVAKHSVSKSDRGKGAAGSHRSHSVTEILEALRRSRSPNYHDRITYEFSVVETITGPNLDKLRLQVRFSKLGSTSQFDDFNQHRNESFWEKFGGRTQMRSDCSITPSFEVGQVYLIFPDSYHVKGYELILDDGDAWLAFVRTHRLKSKRGT